MTDCKELLGSWYPYLSPFLKSDKFKKIIQTLKQESSQAKVFPKSQKIFNCFRYCPIDRTMIVFLGTNPYYAYTDYLYGSSINGFLFGSSAILTEVQEKIWDSIEKTYDKPFLDTRRESKTWEKWAEQGILFLPLDLTINGKKGAHLELWKPFIKYVLETIKQSCSGITFVLCGKDAEKYIDYLDPTSNDVVIVEHPAKSAQYKRNWKNKSLFLYLDRVTNMIFNRKINWYV